MRCRLELRKIVTAERVPVAVSVCIPDVLRERGEHCKILLAAVAFHQSRVVGNKGLNELIVVGVLVFLGIGTVGLELTVDEQPLDPTMSNAAGVHRQSELLRYAIDTTQTAAEKPELLLRELRRLVHEYPVKFLTLILVSRLTVALEMPQLNGRAVDEVILVKL